MCKTCKQVVFNKSARKFLYLRSCVLYLYNIYQIYVLLMFLFLLFYLRTTTRLIKVYYA